MKKIKVLIGIFILLLFAFAMFNYIYKGHRDVSSEKPSYVISAVDLENTFLENEEFANKKYLDQTIVINGKVTDVDVVNNIIILEGKVSAKCNVPIVNVNFGTIIKVKGRFIGYDDLLEEYRMDECTVID
ncbi:hypothetical protein ACFS5J_12620 [Flavobacterium chuncheonense]|uniref:tRNA_anti-like n=1 Tax=Flavobacterium chuncheonense TaxID=2026653 RepID=A0ABW5YP52_9FLAO